MADNAVVVGYDGSAGARVALRWALEEAALVGAPVRLVSVVETPLRTAPVPMMPGGRETAAGREDAQRLVDAAVAEAARAARVPVDVTGVVLSGQPVTVLCEQSRQARTLVLGSRGLGGFTGLFVGSVSIATAMHAHCPVVVVRDGDPTHQAGEPVAVGVDDSPQAQLAVGFAMEEAAGRGVGLVAVRAWTPPPVPWHIDVRPLVLDVDELETAERHALHVAVDGWRDKYPRVPVTTRLVPTDPRHALADVSHQAALVVVGSRGRGGFAGLLLGSVGQYLLHHAACPVAVVRNAG